MDRPTFSQSWSRVSRLTPTLRPQVQIHRQLYRGEPWHVVHDPVSNNFFRLNPVAYHFVGLLDGRRSVDDTWRLTLERFGDLAPTQNEVIGLLGQLNESNLLRVDLPPDAAPLLQRQRRRRLRQWGGQLMNIFSLRFPLFNPDRFLNWLVPLFRPVLSLPGLVLWCLWLGFCLYNFLPHMKRFTHDAGSVLDPNNWGWMIVLFLATKAWHELGHGLMCKRFGGAVPEVGIMLLVLFPAPFVDATSSWNFPDKWKRLLVGAAGMMFELTLAGAAALVWLHAEENSLARQISFNMVFMASVTTVLFNANPLLRFDGYYVLSDLLEIPNLADRSNRHVRYLVQRYAYGLTNAQPVSTIPVEGVELVIYCFASQIYRVLVMFGIAMFIANKIPTVGLIIAAWSLTAWAVIPAVKFVHWLATSPMLWEHRPRAVAVTAATAVVLFLSIGVWPAPDHRRTEGVVESQRRAEIAVQTDGFIREVRAEAGQKVAKGDIILVGENPELVARRKDLIAQLKRLQAVESQGLAQDRVVAQINQAKIKAVREELDDVGRRLDDLVVRSPDDGTLAGPPLRQLEGRFLKRGQVVTQVADLENTRVTALIDQAEAASGFFEPIEKVELRSAGRVEQVLPSQVMARVPGGRMDLPHPALGYPGGGSIPTRQDDPKGLQTTRPQFEMWLRIPHDEKDLPLLLPGERVHVRFTMQKRRPYLEQWAHRLQQVLRERLAV